MRDSIKNPFNVIARSPEYSLYFLIEYRDDVAISLIINGIASPDFRQDRKDINASRSQTLFGNEKTNVWYTIGEYMNHWDIPDWLEKEIKERDKACVYCRIQLIEKMPLHGPRKAVATWEHIINDQNIVNRENIARCCVACNASKGTKRLSDWIQSNYCKKRGINKDTVAEVVKNALRTELETDT